MEQMKCKKLNDNYEQIFSIIDKSVKKGVIHKNNAARRKSAINSISNNL